VHSGRKSGKQYSTPVGAERAPEVFTIPPSYGTQADSLQNVMAARRATVLTKGETYDVAEPEEFDAATASPRLSPRRRRAFERLAISQHLTVKLALWRWAATPRELISHAYAARRCHGLRGAPIRAKVVDTVTDSREPHRTPRG